MILVFARCAALCTVMPPNRAAEDPVVEVKWNVMSSKGRPASWQNLWQCCCASSTQVLFPHPAGPVTNMMSCSSAPLFLSSWTKSFLSLVQVQLMVALRNRASSVSPSVPFWTSFKKNEQHRTPNAIACFSSSFAKIYIRMRI